MTKRMMKWAPVVLLSMALAGCGGGGSEDIAAAEPVGAPAAAVTGLGGGTVRDAGSGAEVIVPPGALETDMTLRVAVDSTGAPPLPAALASAGNTYAITPHGGEFTEPVEVRIPAPTTTLLPNQALRLAKAQPGGEWELLEDTLLADGMLSARVRSFSYFVPVVVTYLLPIAQTLPLQITTSLDCGTQPCEPALGTVIGTFKVTSNGGQVSNDCINPDLRVFVGSYPTSQPGSSGSSLPLAGGTVVRTVTQPSTPFAYFFVRGRCGGPSPYTFGFGQETDRRIRWPARPGHPTIAVVRAPTELDVVAGTTAALEAVLSGGASAVRNGTVTNPPPTAADRAVVDWQRSDDNGDSWRAVTRSYEHEAEPNPAGDGYPWRYWRVRHRFVAASSDQGALFRVHACYAPPDVPAPPCVSGPATRLNVLQQSALPAIIDAPRSVLVKTGQTASFFATAEGAPAPTLQWQTRPANSTGAWVAAGTGPGGTTASYTTPPLGLADNGMQFRIIAKNALGSAESAGVTVSVSDLDVAPVVTTQPAPLSVTAGSDAAFAISATGTEALSYQWRKDGVPILGANSPVLRLQQVTALQAGAYSVNVSNAAGAVMSNPAALSVNAASLGAAPPTIVTQPVSVLINAGNTATFAVGTAGGGVLAYQWLKNGQPIAGANAAFHSIPMAGVDDAGTYAVRVGDGTGPVLTSDNAMLTVNAGIQPAPVSLQSQPAPQVQPPGGSAIFAVAASGSGPVTYQWRKNGTPIAGANGPVLPLSNVTGSDAASYSVTVGNPLSTVTSDPAVLIVLGAPIIGTPPAATSVSEGQTATFTVAATGSSLGYQWTRNAIAISGATAASHTTPASTLADSGAVYGVIVYNGAGVAISQSAVLTVTPAAPAAKSWGPPQLIETDDLGNAELVHVAANAIGQAIAVWQQAGSVTINIFAARYTPGIGWGAREPIDITPFTSQQPRVAIDAQGNAIVVWMNSDNFRTNIWARRYTPAGGWGSAQLIETGDGGADGPQVAFDGAGNAIAVFSQGDGPLTSLMANRFVPGSGWGTASAIESDSTGAALAPAIAVDTNGNAVVVWVWANVSVPGHNVWANRYTAGAGWGTAGPIDVGYAPNVTAAPQVALDGAGSAIAVWHRPDGSSPFDTIWTSRYVDGDGWGAPSLLETDDTNSARNARVAFDAGGNATVVWTQSDGVHTNVLANRFTAGAGWGTPLLIETDNGGSAHEAQLVVDGNGNVTAVWWQIAGFTTNIWSNRYEPGSGWGTALIIDNAPEYARGPQIAVDGFGNVVAAWDQITASRKDIWATTYR
ncbi:MAG: hypothetical protein H7Y61_04175 [Rhizobiales bacterium]|nr:hypothetical protein [Rhizobacter sp.]